MRSIRTFIVLLPLAILACLPSTSATPKISDTLLLPLRIPSKKCPNFNVAEPAVPGSVGKPATKCSWLDILQCGASELACGQACVETVQSVPIELPPLSLQCSACLTPATVSHCALCFGTHVPTGQAPRPHSSLPSVSRDQLCAAAKEIPEAECILHGFCPLERDGLPGLPSNPSWSSSSSTSADLAGQQPTGLALLELIIASLEGVVASVDVQPAVAVTVGDGAAANMVASTTGLGPLVTGSVSIAAVSTTLSSSSSSSTTASEGRARRLCGRYYCAGSK